MPQEEHRPGAGTLAVLVAVCLAGAELGQLTAQPAIPSSLPGLWPATGVLVAMLVHREPRRWASFIAAACAAVVLSALLHGRGLAASVTIGALCSMDAAVAAWLARRLTGEPLAMDRIQHGIALVFAGALAPLAGALLAPGLLSTAVPATPSPFVRWWFGEAIGILVTAPLVLTLRAHGLPPPARLRSWKALEAAIVLVAGLVVARAVFTGQVLPMLRVPAFLLPFLLWPVFRFGPSGGPASVFIMCVLALWHASRGLAPLVLVPDVDIPLRAQGAMVIAGGSLVLMTSMVAERNRVAQERAALVAELQQALAEIKTLRGFIPICAWCHKVRDDRGFWQQLERYLDERTDATFSHSICPACTAREQERLAAQDLPEQV